MMKPIIHMIQKAEKHVNRPWYPFAVALLSFLDLFIFVIPIEAVMITSIMAAPKRWISISLFTIAGFMLGTLAFALIVHHYGFPIIEYWAPKLSHSELWLDSDRWMDQYGLWAVFGVALLPIAIHPILAIAVLADVSIPSILLVLLLSRLIKYGAYAWIASHSPKLLSKVAPDRKEIEEILHDEPENKLSNKP